VIASNQIQYFYIQNKYSKKDLIIIYNLKQGMMKKLLLYLQQLTKHMLTEILTGHVTEEDFHPTIFDNIKICFLKQRRQKVSAM
jgi:hypothetical protein